MRTKTRAGWRESNLDLSHYLQIGDVVDEETADYFLGVLPPACYTCNLIQIGNCRLQAAELTSPCFSRQGRAANDAGAGRKRTKGVQRLCNPPSPHSARRGSPLVAGRTAGLS